MSKEINILGDNVYALSMIFETLYSIEEQKCSVRIFLNRDFNGVDTFDNQIHDYCFIKEDSFFLYSKNPTYIAGMSPSARKFLFEHYVTKVSELHLFPLIHPSSVISSSSLISAGVRIEPSVTIGPFAVLEECSFINRGAIIGHHTTIGKFVNINPGAIINGKCLISEGVTIGSGAIVNDGITIGKNSIIGSGSVVTKDIPENVLAFGSPAKIIRALLD